MKETKITQIIAQIKAQRQHSQVAQSDQLPNSELTQNIQLTESATMSQIASTSSMSSTFHILIFKLLRPIGGHVLVVGLVKCDNMYLTS